MGPKIYTLYEYNKLNYQKAQNMNFDKPKITYFGLFYFSFIFTFLLIIFNFLYIF